MVLNGANHFTMSGQPKRPLIVRRIPGMEKDPNLAQNHALIRAAAVAFFQWTLLDDQGARHYLDDGGFKMLVGEHGKFESKPRKR